MDDLYDTFRLNNNDRYDGNRHCLFCILLLENIEKPPKARAGFLFGE